MKVLYDYQAFMDPFGGVSNCFVKLISHLPKAVEWELGVKESSNYHLKEDKSFPDYPPLSKTAANFITKSHFPLKGTLFNWINNHFQGYRSSLHINRDQSISLLKKGDFDIFHPTFFNEYFLPYLNGKPFVLTVHDMITETFPELYKNSHQTRQKALLCPLASHIITVSQKTKEDLIKYLNIPDDKITVIYHSAPAINKDLLNKKAIIEGEYFLYTGRRGGEGHYKNFIPTVKEFKRFVDLSGRRDIKLVCTAGDFTADENNLFKDLGIQDQMIHFRASDAEIINLYHNAKAFIFPSLYEGFGIPILESYIAGCPTMLNRKSCFPEIAGDAAIYFTLDNEQQNLAEAMIDVINMSESDRETLIARQNSRLSLFSWEKSAQQLYNVYEKVLGC